MTIQTDLRTVTNRIQTAREALLAAETRRILAKRDVAQSETALDVARRSLMARSDAGPNDTARRAYAERETGPERDRLERAQQWQMDADIDALEATTALKAAEDERRYLENLIALAIHDVTEQRELEVAYGTFGNLTAADQPAGDTGDDIRLPF